MSTYDEKLVRELVKVACDDLAWNWESEPGVPSAHEAIESTVRAILDHLTAIELI